MPNCKEKAARFVDFEEHATVALPTVCRVKASTQRLKYWCSPRRLPASSLRFTRQLEAAWSTRGAIEYTYKTSIRLSGTGVKEDVQSREEGDKKRANAFVF